jgi:hypothetical protein
MDASTAEHGATGPRSSSAMSMELTVTRGLTFRRCPAWHRLVCPAARFFLTGAANGGKLPAILSESP